MSVDDSDALRAALLAVGAVLVLGSAYPYLVDVVRGRTRPRVVSWVIWTLLGGIATVAAAVEGEVASATLTAAATLETGTIAVVGWRCGNRAFERLDAACLAGVAVGLLLWSWYDSPFTALVAAVTIDLLAAAPTVRHAWRKPREETTIAYLLCAAAAVCSLTATPRLTLMGGLYPLYLLAINGVIAALTMRTPRRVAQHRADPPPVRTPGPTAGRHRVPRMVPWVPAPRVAPENLAPVLLRSPTGEAIVLAAGTPWSGHDLLTCGADGRRPRARGRGAVRQAPTPVTVIHGGSPDSPRNSLDRFVS